MYLFHHVNSFIVSRTNTLNEDDLEKILNKEDIEENFVQNKKSKFLSQENPQQIPPLDKNVVISMPSSQEKSNSQNVEKKGGKKKKKRKGSERETESRISVFPPTSHNSQVYDNSNLLFAPKIAEKKNGKIYFLLTNSKF